MDMKEQIRINNAYECSNTAVKEMLDIYECMSESEQRAFDWGVAYRSVLSATTEMEDLLKGGGITD